MLSVVSVVLFKKRWSGGHVIQIKKLPAIPIPRSSHFGRDAFMDNNTSAGLGFMGGTTVINGHGFREHSGQKRMLF